MKANTQIRLSTNESFAAFVGLDRADEKHVVVLLAANSQRCLYFFALAVPRLLSYFS